MQLQNHRSDDHELAGHRPLRRSILVATCLFAVGLAAAACSTDPADGQPGGACVDGQYCVFGWPCVDGVCEEGTPVDYSYEGSLGNDDLGEPFTDDSDASDTSDAAGATDAAEPADDADSATGPADEQDGTGPNDGGATEDTAAVAEDAGTDTSEPEDALAATDASDDAAVDGETAADASVDGDAAE